MKTGYVSATVVSTIRHPSFDGHRLLWVDLEGPDGKLTGDYTIALDTISAGPGEHVLVLDEGSSARLILGDDEAPVRAVIVGIIDAVTLP